MSRKPTHHGQNDISIIGNLPQRLQKKIADKAKLEEIRQEDDETKIAGNATAVKDTTKLDLILKSQRNADLDELNDLQNKIPGILHLQGSNRQNGIKEALEKPRELEISTATVPGILRLNSAVERTRISKVNRSKSNKNGRIQASENLHKVLRPKNVLREDEILKTLLPSSPARSFVSKKYPEWFDETQINDQSKNLRQLYDTLTGLIQQNAVLQHWSYFMETRKQLLLIFKHILLHHLKLCCEMKCDNFFWKLLFYNVREYLKYANCKLATECLLDLINEGIGFYGDLYESLEGKYFTVASQKSPNGLKDSATQSQKSEKFEFLAKVAAQKLLICLGDLSRYRAMQLQSNDYGEAATYYRKAQVLIPTNGIPYNQLAIVAIHDRKKFDAIYLHMRSLMSSNAIHSAKESLLILFDEIRKKFEKTEQKESPVHQYKNSNSSSASGSNNKIISPLRKEVWIHPDGVRRLHRTDVDDCKRRLSKPAKNVEQRLDEMPEEDLTHRFLSVYLYVIGKLYTGIGMESIQAHQTKLLSQLNALLKRNTKQLLLTRSKVLKMVALNIFVLYHNVEKDTSRYYTFTFCNQMFGVLLQKCNQLLTAMMKDEIIDKLESVDRFYDINTLLQFIKVYIDYLSLNVRIWEPTRNEDQYFIDPWSELQTLFVSIEGILKQDHIVRLLSEFQPLASDIILEENKFLCGFTPLATNQSRYFNTLCSSSIESQQFLARICKIQEFNSLYSENSERLQMEDSETNSSFVLEELNGDIKSALETLQSAAASNDSDNIECLDNKSSTCLELQNNKSSNNLKTLQLQSINDTDAGRDGTENLEVAQLTKLKKELELQTNAKRLYNTKLEEILKLVDTKIYIEVRPKYLMPDTNCFIDFLDDFEKLLKNYKRYTLVIPLTVVRELDGLSKGIKLESRAYSMQKHRIHHFDDVSTCAKRSLDFIKSAKQNVKCVTTKGSMINASLFALAEEEYMSNDDRILATALALSKTMCRETSKDDKCFVQTELVLITTDRNLRVKALSRNLAVSELDEFLQWAKVCNEA